MAWFHLREKGRSQHVQPPLHHAFFASRPKETFTIIAMGGDARFAPKNSLESVGQAAGIHPNIVIWIDVQATSDAEVVLFGDKTLPTANDVKHVGLSSYEELSQINIGADFTLPSGVKPYQNQPIRIPKLTDALKHAPGHRFILNVVEYRPGFDVALAKAINDAKAGDRVLIQSDLDGVLKDMRTLQAMWLYGTSRAQGTQLKLLLTLGLGGLAPIKGDTYISVAREERGEIVSEDIVGEIHRRGLRAFVGPVDTKAKLEDMRAMGVDGIVTREPAKIWALLFGATGEIGFMRHHPDAGE